MVVKDGIEDVYKRQVYTRDKWEPGKILQNCKRNAYRKRNAGKQYV